MLAIKTSVTNVNNIFYGLINRLDTVEERINELEEMFNKKSPKLKCKEKEILKKKTKPTRQNIQELWDSYERYNIHVMGTPKGSEKEKAQTKYLKQ